MKTFKERKREAYKRWYDKNKKKCAVKCKAWRKRNPLKVMLTRFKNSSFTPELFERILLSQKHRCAICAIDLRLSRGKRGGNHADHNHKTKKPRGILCPQCNMGLGHFKDDPVLLLKAANYLEIYELV